MLHPSTNIRAIEAEILRMSHNNTAVGDVPNIPTISYDDYSGNQDGTNNVRGRESMLPLDNRNNPQVQDVVILI